jgi:hypothetical protein
MGVGEFSHHGWDLFGEEAGEEKPDGRMKLSTTDSEKVLANH